MTRRSHLAAWLLLCLAALLAWPAWTGTERLAVRAQGDAEALHQTFGPRTSALLLTAAARAQAVFGHQGVDDLLHPKGTPPHADDRSDRHLPAASRLLLSRVDHYLAALRLQVHGAVLRILGMAAWSMLLAPLCIATVVDGWVERAVKAASLEYENPAAFALATHLFIACTMLPIAVLVAPVAVPPLFMPVCLAAAMVPLRMAIAHAQPVFRR